jgi:hypothetical protein
MLLWALWRIDFTLCNILAELKLLRVQEWNTTDELKKINQFQKQKPEYREI